MRISVFDPHPVVHRALTSLLPANGFSVVSQATDGRQAVKMVQESRADIVITEVPMPHCDGLQMLDALQQAELPVQAIVFAADANPVFVARAITYGARDYVLKTEPVENLLQALRLAARPASGIQREPVRGATRRGSHLWSSIRGQLASRKIVHANPRDLTQRELQVLCHLGFGLSNREIALSLGISVETVKEHVQNILRKLDARDRTQAAVWSVRNGLSRFPD